MGSEGYLINQVLLCVIALTEGQFIVSKTNKRTDQWGGSYENRIRLHSAPHVVGVILQISFGDYQANTSGCGSRLHHYLPIVID